MTPEQQEDAREADSPKDDGELEWAQFIRKELIKKHGTSADDWQPLITAEALLM
ncbi:hypothetical protein [Cohnella faecalis]|uniref:hypothetical protein n=1 Tax=Cohnella faecalis TaxID=2315694 RepID=UPI001314C66D|nr:hypothetical protein [Cohnella faecalis]